MLAAVIGASAQSEEVLLLGGWKFQKGAAKGAEAVQYDDSKWQQVTVPHDWAISGPFDKARKIGASGYVRSTVLTQPLELFSFENQSRLPSLSSKSLWAAIM